MGGRISDERTKNEVAGELVVAGAGAASSSWEAGSAERQVDETEAVSDEEEPGELRVEGEAVRHGQVDDARRVKMILDPKKPSKEEVDEHCLTHIPYRNWCEVCVKCHGKELSHKKRDGSNGVPEYAFDYCFPGDELGYKLVVLVGHEKTSGMTLAVTVPTKGSIGRFTVDKAVDFIEEVGDANSRIVVKTDQEPAILTFVRDLVEARPENRTIAEESPVKSSGSNGRAVNGKEGEAAQSRTRGEGGRLA